MGLLGLRHLRQELRSWLRLEVVHLRQPQPVQLGQPPHQGQRVLQELHWLPRMELQELQELRYRQRSQLLLEGLRHLGLVLQQKQQY